MLRKSLKAAVALVMCAVMLLSSGVVAYAASSGQQNDPIITRNIIMPTFNRISVGSNWIVTYVQSSAHSIRVEMPESLLERYTFNVRNNTLMVESVGSGSGGSIVIGGIVIIGGINGSINISNPATPRPRIYIFAPTLEAASLSGVVTANNWSPITTTNFTLNMSGTATANNWSPITATNVTLNLSGVTNSTLNVRATGTLTANVSGTSSLTLSGTAPTARMNVSGTANVRAFGLQARNANVSASGTSNVQLSVSESLGGTASGTSRINFIGDPRLSVRTSGLGRVVRVG